MKKIFQTALVLFFIITFEESYGQCNPQELASNCVSQVKEGFTFLKNLNIDGLNGSREKVDLDVMMKEADIITLHTVSTDENDNLINEDRIAMMKKTAILVNTSKGSLIDYDALYNALKEKRIAGAALDVFPMEPIDEDNEFLELDNAIVAPHIGGDTLEVIDRQSALLLEDVKAWLNGQKPKNVMNPEVFDK